MTVEHEGDVVVAGGGPAGSSAAIAAAHAGLSVIIVERARFPRPHVGESLPPKVGPLFSILGVERELAAQGFLRMRGTTVSHGGDHLTHDFDPSGAQLGWQVDRARFDALLLERARAVGCRTIEASAIDVVRDGAARIAGIRARKSSGEEVELAARFVVDATGARGLLSHRLGCRTREAIRTIALTAYWRGARLPSDFPAENTLFEMQEDGWLWSVLLDDGRRNVTVGVDAEALRSSRSAREVYDAALARSRLIAPLIETASIEGELAANDATWACADRFAGDGFLLAGDAASFVDPLTSHGVLKAVQSGIIGAATINTALNRPADAAMALAYYDQNQARTFERYADVALTFYRGSPYASSPFWSVRMRPDLGIERVFTADDSAGDGERRERFLARVRELGGALVVRAKSSLIVEERPTAEAGWIVKKSALVARDRPELSIGAEADLDVALLRSLLDGRALERVFEDYVARAGAPRSSDRARRLIGVLTTLAEKDLLSFE